jgi:glutamyl-tRNA synthetase
VLARRLGFAVPAYAHVPLVLGPGGQRLAKRHGAATLADLRARGVEPPEVLEVMAASLGLGPGVATVADLLPRFDRSDCPGNRGASMRWCWCPPARGERSGANV